MWNCDSMSAKLNYCFEYGFHMNGWTDWWMCTRWWTQISCRWESERKKTQRHEIIKKYRSKTSTQKWRNRQYILLAAEMSAVKLTTTTKRKLIQWLWRKWLEIIAGIYWSYMRLATMTAADRHQYNFDCYIDYLASIALTAITIEFDQTPINRNP